jgi:hypothetical protein
MNNMKTNTAAFILVSLLFSSSLGQERDDQKPGTAKWKRAAAGR